MKLIDELNKLDMKYVYINSEITKYKVNRSGNVYRVKSNGKLSELKMEINKSKL